MVVLVFALLPKQTTAHVFRRALWPCGAGDAFCPRRPSGCLARNGRPQTAARTGKSSPRRSINAYRRELFARGAESRACLVWPPGARRGAACPRAPSKAPILPSAKDPQENGPRASRRRRTAHGWCRSGRRRPLVPAGNPIKDKNPHRTGLEEPQLGIWRRTAAPAARLIHGPGEQNRLNDFLPGRTLYEFAANNLITHSTTTNQHTKHPPLGDRAETNFPSSRTWRMAEKRRDAPKTTNSAQRRACALLTETVRVKSVCVCLVLGAGILGLPLVARYGGPLRVSSRPRRTR